MAKVDLTNFITGDDPANPQGGSQEPVRLRSVPRGAEPALRTPALHEAASVAAQAAAAIPEPHGPVASGPLTDAEAAEFRACEEAIRSQQLSFVWGIGKALHVINQGRLYRERYARFDTYVQEVWELSPARAYQLISTWPIARKLAISRVVEAGSVNEGQVRALMPIVREHGVDAAVMVYETVTETAADIAGAKVTARVLKGVTELLPAGPLHHAEVAEQVRAFLTAPPGEPPGPRPWETARGNALKALRLIADSSADPAEVRQVVTELRSVLDEIEASLAEGTPPPVT
jgi:hypothetical protein